MHALEVAIAQVLDEAQSALAGVMKKRFDPSKGR